MKLITTWLLLLWLPLSSATELQVVDDTGEVVRLTEPPTRIVSFAPHLTEMLFELGVGDKIVATVAHSDYPKAAQVIPRLGDAFSVSLEAVVAQRPDIVFAWLTGGNQRTVSQMKKLGYAVYLNEAEQLADIAATFERMGLLVGRPVQGTALAEGFRMSISEIGEQYQSEQPKRVFFQIADPQLYTVNDAHLIGQSLAVCGADNIFGELPMRVPIVSYESIVAANPDVIVIALPEAGFETRWEQNWADLGWGARVRPIDASLITRPGLRMAEGIKSLCKTVSR